MVKNKGNVKVRMVGDKALMRHLGLLSQFVRSFKPALKDVADQVHEEEKRIFSSEGSYDGRKAWKKLSDKYQTRKNKIAPGKSILRLTDKLYKQATGKEGVYEITDKKMETGVDVPYSRVHQYGYSKRNITARPYLTIGKTQAKKWNTIMDRYIYEQAKKSGFSVVRIGV